MEKKTFNEIDKKYDLEIDKIVETIKEKNAKKILLQFPEGLKPYSQIISDEIENRMNHQCACLIWLGTCFGGCDIPLNVEEFDVDLIIQFGHSEWDF